MICIIRKLDIIINIILVDAKEYQYDHLHIKCDDKTLIVNSDSGRVLVKPGKQEVIVSEEINYLIYVPLFEQNFNRFAYYQASQRISIGNSIDDDIYIQTCTHDRVLAIIEKGVLIPKSHHVYVDNHLATKQMDIVNKNIQIENCRLIVGPTFIMVTMIDNVYVNLSPHQLDINAKTINYPRQLPVIKKYHHYFEPIVNPLKLNKPPVKSARSYNNNLISMGPMLMMSFASVTSGFINAFNGYNQGRAVIEILPSLIIPLTMLISCLLFNPLQKMLNKKQSLKDYIDTLSEYYICSAKMIKTFNYASQKKEAYILKQYIMADEVGADLRNNDLLWSKNETHGDFMKVFMGFYNKQLDTISKSTGDEYIDTLLTNYSLIEKAPLILNLLKQPRIGIVDDADDVVFNYLLAQMCIYSAEGYQLVLFTNKNYLEQHYLLKIMPNLANNQCFIATAQEEALKINKILQGVNKPVICFINNNELNGYLESTWSVIANNYCLPTNQLDCLIEMEGFLGKLTMKDSPSIYFSNNHLIKIDLNSLAYQLLMYSESNPVINQVSLELIDYYDPIDIEANWQKHQYSSSLPIILGVNSNQKPITLDISSNAHGPHGLVAGTTGSGKSELLLTIVMALASMYPPSLIQMVIIDFKGGDLIGKCTYKQQVLPHILQAITNLDSQSIDRAIISLKRECEYRQRKFNELSNSINASINNIDEYINCFSLTNKKCDLSHLLIIVDEFAQVKDEAPDFMNQIVAIARVGRSLGIHLLLATQRPQGIVNDQIKANMHFTISLHVNDKQDSLDLIEDTIATTFNRPGQFAFRCDETLSIGQAIYCQAPIKEEKCGTVVLDKKITIKEKKPKNYVCQKNSLIQLMCSLTDNHERRTLWLEPLKQVIHYQSHDKALYLGKSDDYHNRQYNDIFLNNDDNLIIYSDNYDNQLRFIISLIKQLINHHSAYEDEILVLTSDKQRYELRMNYQHMVGVVDMNNQKGSRALFNYLQNHHERHLLFIIDDLSYFNQLKDNNKIQIQRITDILNSHHIHMIIATNNLQAVPTNLMSKSMRMMLGCCQNDICIQLFSKKTIYTQLNNCEALIKEGNNIHKLSLYYEKEIDNYEEVEGFSKHRLLLLPDRIDSKELPINSIGIDEESLEPIILEKNYMVVSHYQEYLDAFKKYFSNMHNVEFHLAKDMSNIHSLKQVLWLGPGYTHQFIMTSNQKDCDIDEGILHHMYKVRRIKLVEGIYPRFN